jgi:hypothetical protein
MNNLPTKTECLPETESVEVQTDRKLFESYINVTESIGTFFLGVLAILLFLALQRSRDRYESLVEQIGSNK